MSRKAIMDRLVFSIMLSGVAGWVVAGCTASDKSATSSSGAAPAQKATPDAAEISAAERVAEQIERRGSSATGRR